MKIPYLARVLTCEEMKKKSKYQTVDICLVPFLGQIIELDTDYQDAKSSVFFTSPEGEQVLIWENQLERLPYKVQDVVIYTNKETKTEELVIIMGFKKDKITVACSSADHGFPFITEVPYDSLQKIEKEGD